MKVEISRLWHEQTDGGMWKIGQYSGLNQKPQQEYWAFAKLLFMICQRYLPVPNTLWETGKVNKAISYGDLAFRSKKNIFEMILSLLIICITYPLCCPRLEWCHVCTVDHESVQQWMEECTLPANDSIRVLGASLECAKGPFGVCIPFLAFRSTISLRIWICSL